VLRGDLKNVETDLHIFMDGRRWPAFICWECGGGGPRQSILSCNGQKAAPIDSMHDVSFSPFGGLLNPVSVLIYPVTEHRFSEVE
jgi:hypothetical protein